MADTTCTIQIRGTEPCLATEHRKPCDLHPAMLDFDQAFTAWREGRDDAVNRRPDGQSAAEAIWLYQDGNPRPRLIDFYAQYA